MRIIGPFIFSLCVLTFLGLLVILLLKYINKDWWEHRRVRIIAKTLPIAGGVAIVFWVLGYFTKNIPISSFGSTTTVVILITFLALIISLPFSGLINSINRWLSRRRVKSQADELQSVNTTRRTILKTAALVFPTAAVAAGGSGIVHGFQKTKVYLLPLQFDNLPNSLDGFRILHLSDSHLGIYRMLDDLEEILFRAEKLKPDLILLTGDIADELELLPDALKMVVSLNPEYGCFASLGNHEYYRGIDEVLTVYQKSDVTLLRSSGRSINVNGDDIHLAGADDPVTMREDNSAFLEQTVSKSLQGAPPEDFSILMSHRPEGFDAAAKLGINLTLSGHTHGGQIGFAGRSIWENFMPDRYLWGSYAKDTAQMYLSSGIGHWLPFRLGCSPEAPIIELTQKV
jgi:predicted MPP superfamily phosphohydrolase